MAASLAVGLVTSLVATITYWIILGFTYLIKKGETELLSDAMSLNELQKAHDEEISPKLEEISAKVVKAREILEQNKNQLAEAFKQNKTDEIAYIKKQIQDNIESVGQSNADNISQTDQCESSHILPERNRSLQKLHKQFVHIPWYAFLPSYALYAILATCMHDENHYFNISKVSKMRKKYNIDCPKRREESLEEVNVATDALWEDYLSIAQVKIPEGSLNSAEGKTGPKSKMGPEC